MNQQGCMTKCMGCDYFEPDGIGFSAVPECTKYKEYACEAAKYCTYKK